MEKKNKYISKKSFFIYIVTILIILVIITSIVINNLNKNEETLLKQIGQINQNYVVQANTEPTKAEATTTSFVTEDVLEDYFNNKVKTELYPVGTVLTTVSSANPSTYISGTTWEAWGQGRVVLGVGSQLANTYTGHGNVSAGNTNHTTAELLGGSHTATMPSHTHTFSATTSSGGEHIHESYYYAYGNRAASGTGRDTPVGGLMASEGKIKYSATTSSAGAHTHTFNTTTEKSSVTNNAYNYSPYITAYMWKRVS